MTLNSVASLLTACLLSAPLNQLGAADSKLDRNTLTGVQGVKVVIEELDSDAVRDGLSVDQLRTDVELRLRQAGVPVSDSSVTFLYVNPAVFRNRVENTYHFYYYTCEVELQQAVTLVSDQMLTLAPTWSVGVTGTVGQLDMSRQIRSSIGDLVDRFINAYLSVRPKK